jgi:hypothetical protein
VSIEVLNQDKNLCYFDTPIQVITIFDHYRYDRSDFDGLSAPQRDYLLQCCKEFDLKQMSGRKYQLKNLGINLIFPRQSILGASPFDCLRYEKADSNTIFVLTPTQAACYFLTLAQKSDSQQYLQKLLSKQSINLKKIKDHVRTENDYLERFNELFSEMSTLLNDINQKLKVKNKRHIGSLF